MRSITLLTASALLSSPALATTWASSVRVGETWQSVCNWEYDAYSYDCYYYGDCYVEVCEDELVTGFASGAPRRAAMDNNGSSVQCSYRAQAYTIDGSEQPWGQITCSARDAAGNTAWCEHWTGPLITLNGSSGGLYTDVQLHMIYQGLQSDPYAHALAMAGPDTLISFTYDDQEQCTSLTVQLSSDLLAGY